MSFIVQIVVKAGRVQHQQTTISRARQKSNPKKAIVRAGSKQSQEKIKQSNVKNTGKVSQAKNKVRQKHGNMLSNVH